MGLIAENPSLQSLKDEPTLEERRALIERVAASEQFRRAARLRQFLLYVGRESLKEGCAEIHEQEIGTNVFGRPDSYDRAADTIVRVNATELRRRIRSYFATSGVQEPFVFEIPLGSYKPIFGRRSTDSTNDLVPSPEDSLGLDTSAPAPEVRNRARSYLHPAWALVSLFLAIACAALIWQIHTMRATPRSWAGQPAVAAFWSGFLDPQRETTIVFADSSISLIEDIRHQPITLEDYTSRRFMEQIQTSDMDADRKADLQEIFNHNLISFGEGRIIRMLTREIPPNYPCDLARARSFSADEIMRNNVILLGGKKAQPWVHLFDNDVNFVMDYDDARSWPFVRNRNPKRGEQPVYPGPGDVGTLLGYATIAYLPNPNRTGHAIILAGTDSDATNAAAAFLTSEDQMEKFRKILHVDRFPPFEVLLKVSRMSGTFFDSELIAYRTYPEPH